MGEIGVPSPQPPHSWREIELSPFRDVPIPSPFDVTQGLRPSRGLKRPNAGFEMLSHFEYRFDEYEYERGG